MTNRRPEWMRALRRLARNSTPANPAAPVPTFGTVRSLNPLRVALDTDPSTTLNYEPPCLEYPTFVGQRVWVQTYGRQVVVVGVSKSASDRPVGWVDLPLSPGREHIGDNRLQYRRHVGKTELRGGITNAGLAANSTASVGQLPQGFAPEGGRVHGYAIPGNSGSAIASLMVLSTGEVQIRVGPTLGSYYLASGVSFDPLA